MEDANASFSVQQWTEYEKDAEKVFQIVGYLDFESTVAKIKNYGYLPSYLRIQKVLLEYFESSSKRVLDDAIDADGLFIQSIFPKTALCDILSLLRTFAHEEHRVRIVVGSLLSQNKDLKRRLDEPSHYTTKKAKRLVSTDGPSTSVCTGLYVNENDSDVDLKYLQDDLNINPSDFNNTFSPSTECLSDYCDDFPYVGTPHTADISTIFTEPECLNNTVGVSLGHSLETDSQATIIAMPENNEHYNIDSNALPDTDLENEIKEVEAQVAANPLTELAYETDGNMADVDSDNAEVDYIEHYLENIEYEEPLSEVEVEAVESTELSREFDLYKQLEGMFSMVSLRRIKKLCKRHGVRDQYVKPTDAVFSAIVSDILAKSIRDRSKSSNNNHNNLGNAVPASASTISSTASHNNSVLPRIASYTSLATEVGGPAVYSPVQSAVILPSMNDEVRYNYDKTTPCSVAQTYTNLRHAVANRIKSDLLKMVEETPTYNIEDDNSETSMILVKHLMEMFPEGCPQYIRKICRGKENSPGVLDDLISQMLDEDYPKRQRVHSPECDVTVEEQLEIFKQILPDADPNYLKIECERLFEYPDSVKKDKLKEFISHRVEKCDYPTMKDYLRKQQLSAQQKQYTTDFSVKKFLELIPDPVKYFNDPKRKPATISLETSHYVLYFLRNHFRRVQLNKIREVFKKHNANILATCKALRNINPNLLMKTNRWVSPMPEAIQEIPILQEIAYIEHKEEILKFMEEQRLAEEIEQNKAKEDGLMHTCRCCYDEEVMPKNIYQCDGGCIFCKECVRRSVEIAFGEGKLEFPCLDDCEASFGLQTLKAVLNPKLFSIIALKKQVEEVKAAGIEDLEVCPFCDFATIPPREDKLFRCLNSECMKESCRLCKEPSHIPLRCEEVEKPDDIKRRTYIEDKMTEALLRKCYKCNLKFIKADGCNKMTCSCGAMMCYVCNKPVKDYTHFNGPGGDKHHLCPLYSDTNKLHQDAVLEGATKAKEEMGAKALVHDPTSDIKQHYEERSRNNPTLMPPQYINPFFNEHRPHVRLPRQMHLHYMQNNRPVMGLGHHQHIYGNRGIPEFHPIVYRAYQPPPR